ncbi:MAG TPA: type IX secretion system outer membrane channel protein PorV [Cyclobacteriaceae bacterium]
MKISINLFLFVVLLTCGHGYAHGQGPNPANTPDELLGQTKAITTAVPFLLISPDARHAALGDAGVASSPDANSSYWNPAKLVFIETAYGGTISYTPWLGKIINDMSISYLSGYYRFTKEQAVSMALKYFDLGEIFFTEDGVNGTNFNPREFSFDLTYSRKLTEELGLGLTGRYIHSNLTGAFNSGGVDARPGKSVAADIGIFYTKQLPGALSSNLSLGASISNIGAKITYSDNNNKDFLPTNLRLGGAYTTSLDSYNTLTFLLDFNKLLVPTIDKDQSLLRGMFSSFTDAPGGFSEEIHEIATSMGVEYWYNKVFAARLGYFLEAYDKGNRKYLTMGAGFRRNTFGFDIAYLVPTNKREHPLAETLRFTILFQLPEKVADQDKSVTD